ncbi:MAG: hypothetical protein ACM4AI_14960 [Acidobacteriota bacterium]
MTAPLNAFASSVLALALLTGATLKFDTPQGWVTKAPTSSMRVAEFTLPKVAGDAEDATLAIFFFGGQGGSVQANLDRWISQMTQPDGRPSKDLAKTTKISPRGLPITLVDLSGTYVAEVSPGSTERFNKPGFRLRAAVVDTKDGPYFVKLTGPEKTVARWDDAFMGFLKSLRVE